MPPASGAQFFRPWRAKLGALCPEAFEFKQKVRVACFLTDQKAPQAEARSLPAEGRPVPCSARVQSLGDRCLLRRD